MKLRDEYQTPLDDAIVASWECGNNTVIAQLPTGGGKTAIIGNRINNHDGASCVVAHRGELVGQIAMSLAKYGVSHRIIGNDKLVRRIDRMQRRELGVSFVNSNAQCAVASIQTLVNRTASMAGWMDQVTLWVIDEAHHCQASNVWGKVVGIFPNAKGLGVTATPCRADGKGLGSWNDGVFDDLITGVDMRWLIDHGYLTDYRVFCAPSDFDVQGLKVGGTGDYTRNSMKEASKKSHIVGDVVSEYLKHAKGLRGVTFTTDVETAVEMARQYTEAGVPAEAVSAKTPDDVREECVRRLESGELMQLVNVDLFGEGFDLPAVSVVSFARPTQSFSLYAQQFGRVLRILEGKDVAFIIDHVGNVIRHGLPDTRREWTLERRDGVGKSKKVTDEIPLTACPECTQPYEKTYKSCPWCGHKVVPAGRSTPEQVEGDLMELTADALAELRQRVDEAQESPESVQARMKYAGAPAIAVAGAGKKVRKKLETRSALTGIMREWQRVNAPRSGDYMKRFYLTFGIDMMTARTLNGVESMKLAEKINEHLVAVHVNSSV